MKKKTIRKKDKNKKIKRNTRNRIKKVGGSPPTPKIIISTQDELESKYGKLVIGFYSLYAANKEYTEKTQVTTPAPPTEEATEIDIPYVKVIMEFFEVVLLELYKNVDNFYQKLKEKGYIDIRIQDNDMVKLYKIFFIFAFIISYYYKHPTAFVALNAASSTAAYLLKDVGSFLACSIINTTPICIMITAMKKFITDNGLGDIIGEDKEITNLVYDFVGNVTEKLRANEELNKQVEYYFKRLKRPE